MYVVGNFVTALPGPLEIPRHGNDAALGGHRGTKHPIGGDGLEACVDGAGSWIPGLARPEPPPRGGEDPGVVLLVEDKDDRRRGDGVPRLPRDGEVTAIEAATLSPSIPRLKRPHM